MYRASPSEFVVPLSKYVKAVFHTRVSVGMRFRMLFETEESSVRRYGEFIADDIFHLIDLMMVLLLISTADYKIYYQSQLVER